MTTTYQTQNVNTPALSSATTAIVSNAARIGWAIQNSGTNPVYVLMGPGASTSVYHVVLKAGTAVNDGIGGTFTQNDAVCYTGIVTVAGTGLNYTVQEFSP